MSKHRAALISDIHGNVVALDAVLADIARRDVDSIVCLGDVAAGGPQPQQAIARIREIACPVVRGNADEWLVTGMPAERETDDYRRLREIVAWAQAQIGDSDRAWLHQLPLTVVVGIEGGVTLLCSHGSPRSNRERILPDTPHHQLERRLAGVKADLLAGGHTHVPMVRDWHGKLLVSSGGVGLPLAGIRDGGFAAFAEYLIVATGSGGPSIELRRVAVGGGAATRAATRSGMPYGREWPVLLARRVRSGNRREAGR